MPEGDVVWLTAHRLRESLAGQVLTRGDFRVPRYATVDLRGQRVTEAVSQGTHLLIRTDKGLTVHTHLKMDGSWRVSPAPIGEALLDQRNLAGIGTWFAAEMLFLRGINPWRPVGSVENLQALVGLGHRLLDANKARTGHASTGDPRPGRETWVYGRAGRPGRRRGTPVKRGEQGPPGQERPRFWCPNCQR